MLSHVKQHDGSLLYLNMDNVVRFGDNKNGMFLELTDSSCEFGAMTASNFYNTMCIINKKKFIKVKIKANNNYTFAYYNISKIVMVKENRDAVTITTTNEISTTVLCDDDIDDIVESVDNIIGHNLNEE